MLSFDLAAGYNNRTMALTTSTMLALRTKAPDFSLNDVISGKKVSLAGFTGSGAVTPPLLVMFICRHCPYVQHIKEELSKLGKDYQNKDIGIVAISSNDARQPGRGGAGRAVAWLSKRHERAGPHAAGTTVHGRDLEGALDQGSWPKKVAALVWLTSLDLGRSLPCGRPTFFGTVGPRGLKKPAPVDQHQRDGAYDRGGGGRLEAGFVQ